MRPVGRLVPIALAALLSACGGKATHAHAVSPARPVPARACPDRAPSAKPDGSAEALAGARVGRVCVVGASERVRSTASFAVRTKKGAALDLGAVHDDLRDLLRLPDVDDAAVYATREADGRLTVVYALEELPVVAAVAFEGVHAFTREELDRAPLARGDRYRPWVGRTLVDTLRRAYADHGYCTAKVDLSVQPAGPKAVRVRVAADEGSRCRFGAITFRGNAKLTTADLARAAGVSQGVEWDEALLERAPLLLQELLYDRGMIQGSVSVERGDVAADATIPVAFVVHEGDVFTLRKLALSGVPDALQRKLAPALKSKPKRVFARDLLKQDMEAVRKALQDQNPGKDVDLEPETTVDEPSKSIDVVLKAQVR